MQNLNPNATAQLPPGQLGLPIVGETLSFLRDRDFSKIRTEKYGKVFKTSLFGQPTLVFTGADANRFLLSHENEYFVSNWPKSTQQLLGPASLSVQTGETHIKRRKLLSQAFQPRAIASYVPVMEALTHQYLQKWETLSELTWYPELRDYSLDIAGQLLVGTESMSQTDLGAWFKTWAEGLFTLPIPLPWTKFGQAMQCRQNLQQAIAAIIQDRNTQTASGNDALSILLSAQDDDGDRLSIDELKDQIVTLLFAGHETLISALTSFCLLLAQHPAVLAKVRAEQASLAQDGALNLDSLKQMTYLEQVLKEVLRLVPPVGGGFRKVIQNCEFSGYLIPEGWTVLYQVGQTHQDPEIYPQPQQFDPDRFNPEHSADKTKPFGYIPFGGGMRECLGREFAKLEMKIFGALLVRNYTWELLPNQDLSLTVTPTPHPRDGLKVSFHR